MINSDSIDVIGAEFDGLKVFREAEASGLNILFFNYGTRRWVFLSPEIVNKMSATKSFWAMAIRIKRDRPGVPSFGSVGVRICESVDGWYLLDEFDRSSGDRTEDCLETYDNIMKELEVIQVV